MTEHTLRDAATAGARGLLLALALVAAVTAAGATGATTVRLPGGDDVAVAHTTTVPIVVDSADGGVGAYNVTVSVADSTNATITGVRFGGDPPNATSRASIADDGSAATLTAAMADTANDGRVTIGAVTLRADSPGRVALDLTVTALGDERGHSYATDTSGTSLTVVDSNASDAASVDGSPSNATPIDVAVAAPGDSATTRSAASGTPDTGQTDATTSGTPDTGQTDGATTVDRPSATPTTAAAGGSRTTGETPGFGVLPVAVALALVAAALLARRRRR